MSELLTIDNYCATLTALTKGDSPMLPPLSNTVAAQDTSTRSPTFRSGGAHFSAKGLLVFLIMVCGLALAQPAIATVFVFDQTTTTVPGVNVQASITIDGDLSNLPTVSSNSDPIFFGDLVGFSFSAPNAIDGTYTLNNFVEPVLPSSFPMWSISPDAISFINIFASDDFFIQGFDASTIRLDTDNSARLCHTTGACVVTGNWVVVPVPEPSPISALIVGLVAFASLSWSRRFRLARARFWT